MGAVQKTCLDGGIKRCEVAMPNAEPHRLPATTLARLVDSGELTAEAVIQSCLERIREREPVVRAWTHLADAAALAAARACDRSGSRGVHLGVLFVIKDFFELTSMT